jgi:Flp pilus assembly protein CpaB
VENLIPRGLLKTRQGTIAVGIGAAVLAAILLLVYLRSYRSSVKGSSEPTTVLVAKRLIPRGTSGVSVATNGLFIVTTVPKGELKLGALSDPASLRGTVAATDIYPDQQLTQGDFVAKSGGALASQLTTTSRAIALPSLKDAAHGLQGAVQAGDHVDIYGQLGGADSPAGPGKQVLGTLLRDVEVLSTPSTVAPGAAVTGNYVLKVPSDQVARVAYMAENGTIWFVLRPANGARGSHPAFVTSQNIWGGRLGQGQTVLGGGD